MRKNRNEMKGYLLHNQTDHPVLIMAENTRLRKDLKVIRKNYNYRINLVTKVLKKQNLWFESCKRNSSVRSASFYSRRTATELWKDSKFLGHKNLKCTQPEFWWRPFRDKLNNLLFVDNRPNLFLSWICDWIFGAFNHSKLEPQTVT